jgi:hypothetical protein
MALVSGTPVAAERRYTWRALRPVLLLGSFVAVWWALMTGAAVAQADDTPHTGQSSGHQHLVDHLRSQVEKVEHQTRQHVQPVRTVVRRVHHDPGVSQMRQQVRTQVPAQVRATVRTTVSTTIARTRGVVEKTPAAPVVDTAETSVELPVPVAQSPTGQGNSPKLRHSSRAPDTSLAGRPSTSPDSVSEALAATGRAPVVAPADAVVEAQGDGPVNGPVDGPVDGPLTPAPPDPCSSPSGSGSSSSTPVGITESSMLGMPQGQRDARTWAAARPSGGPADEPGSSPD